MLDEKSKEWQKRFETVWDLNGEGQYRLGSPGQRLMNRFLTKIDRKASINEYGSGTGRAVVEMIKTDGHCQHPIRMVDIALNAMEDECQTLLDDDQYAVTFTHASLWDLPKDFPHAEWGYCIDVLCFLPPEKLDDALKEIKRTCDNLFCQIYDWDDVRCGINLTTIKGDSAWWATKLRKHWNNVIQEVSLESSRRYIFVCSNNVVPERQRRNVEWQKKDGTIRDLMDQHYRETAWIVGRGPSLLNITKEHFGPGPVITLNEAIQNIKPLDLPNKLFNLWRNGDPPVDLLTYLPEGTTLLLCDNPVLQDPPSSTMFKDWLPRKIFECQRDLKCSPPATFSMKAALEIAVYVLGCKAINFISFDSCTGGDYRVVLGNKLVQSKTQPNDYNERCQIITKRVQEMGVKMRWIMPGKKDIISWDGGTKDCSSKPERPITRIYSVGEKVFLSEL